MLAALRTLGLQPQVLYANTDSELDTVFANLVQQHLDALVIGGDPFFNSQGGHLGALSVRHAVPTIFNFADLFDSYRQVGIYAGRILNGEKSADLPVQQATKAELILNLKTAKALGLIVPNTLIGRADKVIE